MTRLMDYARGRIAQVQNGEIERHSFPEEMKGEIAKDVWHDAKFAFGMEYGYLLAMVDLLKHLETDDEPSDPSPA